MAKYKYNKNLFEKLLGASQYKLIYNIMPNHLQACGYSDIEWVGDNLYAHGNVPVMLVAHADIVGTDYPTEFIYATKGGKTTIKANKRTLGGDDRCGLYIMLEAMKKLNVRPYICVTHDEEKGCIGASEFVTRMPYNENEIKFMIELDRRGSNDLVFYDSTSNTEFVEFCEKGTGWKEAYGSFSDICEFMESWKICGVNMSCGYYREHTSEEYVVIDEMLNTVKTLVRWLNNMDYDTLERFEFIPLPSKYWGSWGVNGSLCEDYDYLYDDLYDVDGDDDTVLHEGVEYTLCADCGALVPMSQDRKKFGIPLCDDCMNYYEDLANPNRVKRKDF